MTRPSVVSRPTRMTRTSSEPWPLIVPGKHLVTGGLVHRQRFAGDRRLIDVASPRDDLAVERDLFAGRTRTISPTRPRPWRLASRRPSRRTHGFGGCQVHQRADRLARAVHAAGFEVLREVEQEDDRRRLRPLADDERAEHRDRHQHVHVERVQTHRAQGPAGGVNAARRDRRSPTRSVPSGPSRTSRRQAGGQRDAGHDEQHEAGSAGAGAVSLFVLEPRAHPGVGNRRRDGAGRQARGVVLHVEPACRRRPPRAIRGRPDASAVAR